VPPALALAQSGERCMLREGAGGVAHGQSEERGTGSARWVERGASSEQRRWGVTARERGASERRRVRARWEKARQSERAVSG
jgi:hypothetical protein